MCIGRSGKDLACACRSTSFWKWGKLNLGWLNLTQTHTIVRALRATVIRPSTNSIWMEWWVFSEMHLIPLLTHGGGGGAGEEGCWCWWCGCCWYAPCGANTWLIFMPSFKWVSALDHLYFLQTPTEHAHTEHVNANELQIFKGTVGSETSAFRGLYSAFLAVKGIANSIWNKNRISV